MQLTETERRTMIAQYLCEEPSISVNLIDYRLSVEFREEGVVFYAVDKWGTLHAIVVVTIDTWQACQCGLAVAFVYNSALDTLENSIVHYDYGLELVA